MEPGATLCNSNINLQNTLRKSGQYMVIKPGTEHRALLRVPTFDQQYTRFKFQNRNY